MANISLPILHVVVRTLAFSKVRNLYLMRSLEAERADQITERADLEA